MSALPIYLKEQDSAKLLKASFDQWNAKNERNQLIARLILSTGLRSGELVNLDIEEINFEERLIHVRKGKGSKDRIVFIDHDTARLLQKFIAGKASGRVFEITRGRVWRIIKDMARVAQVTQARKISPHKLRHTFAINWIQRGGDIESLRRLLGHARLNTTQIYLNFDFDWLRAQYDRLQNTQHQRRLVR